MEKLLVLLAISLAIFCVGLTACSPPLAITDIKVVTVDEGGYQCLSWSTNRAAQCKVTYCAGSLCSTSPLEPEYGILHCIGIPAGGTDITVTAIGRDGQTCSINIE